MVELKLKVEPKGQILIPKIIRGRYGIVPGGYVIVKLGEDGIILSGRPSIQELFKKLEEHRRKIKSMGVKAKLGDLRGIYLEMEFE